MAHTIGKRDLAAYVAHLAIDAKCAGNAATINNDPKRVKEYTDRMLERLSNLAKLAGIEDMVRREVDF